MEKEKLERISKLLAKNGMKMMNTIRVEREAKDEDLRFFHVLAKDRENKEYFLKILAGPEKEEAYEKLRREIVARQALAEQFRGGQGKSFLNSVPFLDGNLELEKGEVYYRVEAFPREADLGLVETDQELENLTAQQARECVAGLFAMQNEIDGNRVHAYVKKKFNIETDEEVLWVLSDIYEDYPGFRENIMPIMAMYEPEITPDMNDNEKAELEDRKYENYVWPRDIEALLTKLDGLPEEKRMEYKSFIRWDLMKEEVGENEEPPGVMPLWLVLELQLDTDNFRGKVRELLDKHEPVISDPHFQKADWQFVHGDFGPKNVFYHDNGTVEFNDWGDAGLTRNKLLALIHDYGAMRSDAWNNRQYREAMDNAIQEFLEREGEAEAEKISDPKDKEAIFELYRKAGQTVVSLGILRSHACLMGFLENYPIKKQREERERARKESTKQDLKKAFEISGIKL